MSICHRGSGSAEWMRSNCSGVTMVRGLRATVGVFTPRQGCTAAIWSLSAVVKIADSIVFRSAIVDADTPWSLSRVIHSRT